MPQAETPKQVPKRVDVKPQGLIRNTGQVDLHDRDPDFEYQSFSTDPKSPAFVDRFTRPHLHGEGQAWVQWMPAWEVVNSQTDRAQASQATAAQGTPVDTRQRGVGDQLMCRMRKSDHAKYMETDRANAKHRSDELLRPDAQRGDKASLTTVVNEGEVEMADQLRQAGHPIPGMAG